MNEVVTDVDQGSCCSFLKSTVKIIFDIYNEEQEYIQAAEGEGGGLFSVRGTFGTANIQPIPTFCYSPSPSLCLLSLHQTDRNVKLNSDFCGSQSVTSALTVHSCNTQGFEVVNTAVWGRRSVPANVF